MNASAESNTALSTRGRSEDPLCFVNMAGHLSADDFFAQLGTLIEKTQQKGHGSVYLTQKRRKHRPLSHHSLRANLPC